ncbi:hypothetical protein WJX74_006195 [Apatococcus lobatus]|uniref:Uncharacterized protein n=1 Tax=Apatococcus lobatus TaxID=904363 RepID=A0AAW1QUD5_9CHLO
MGRPLFWEGDEEGKERGRPRQNSGRPCIYPRPRGGTVFEPSTSGSALTPGAALHRRTRSPPTQPTPPQLRPTFTMEELRALSDEDDPSEDPYTASDFSVRGRGDLGGAMDVEMAYPVLERSRANSDGSPFPDVWSGASRDVASRMARLRRQVPPELLRDAGSGHQIPGRPVSRDPVEEGATVPAADSLAENAQQRAAANAQMARAEAIAADVLRNPPFANPAARAHTLPPSSPGALNRRSYFLPEPTRAAPEAATAGGGDLPTSAANRRLDPLTLWRLTAQHAPWRSQPNGTAAVAADAGVGMAGTHPTAAAPVSNSLGQTQADSPTSAGTQAAAGLAAAMAATPRAGSGTPMPHNAAELLRAASATEAGRGRGALTEDIMLYALRQAGAAGMEPLHPNEQWHPAEVPDIILDTARAIVAEDRVDEFFPGLIASFHARGQRLESEAPSHGPPALNREGLLAEAAGMDWRETEAEEATPRAPTPHPMHLDSLYGEHMNQAHPWSPRSAGVVFHTRPWQHRGMQGLDAENDRAWEEDLECLSEPADGMDHADSDTNEALPPLIDYESSAPASAEYTSDEDEWRTAGTDENSGADQVAQGPLSPLQDGARALHAGFRAADNARLLALEAGESMDEEQEPRPGEPARHGAVVMQHALAEQPSMDDHQDQQNAAEQALDSGPFVEELQPLLASADLQQPTRSPPASATAGGTSLLRTLPSARYPEQDPAAESLVLARHPHPHWGDLQHEGTQHPARDEDRSWTLDSHLARDQGRRPRNETTGHIEESNPAAAAAASVEAGPLAGQAAVGGAAPILWPRPTRPQWSGFQRAGNQLPQPAGNPLQQGDPPLPPNTIVRIPWERIRGGVAPPSAARHPLMSHPQPTSPQAWTAPAAAAGYIGPEPLTDLIDNAASSRSLQPSGHSIWLQNRSGLTAMQAPAIYTADAAGSGAVQAGSPGGVHRVDVLRPDLDANLLGVDTEDEDDYFQMLASIMDEAQAAAGGGVREETWAVLRRQMLHRAANRQQGQPPSPSATGRNQAAALPASSPEPGAERRPAWDRRRAHSQRPANAHRSGSVPVELTAEDRTQWRQMRGRDTQVRRTAREIILGEAGVGMAGGGHLNQATNQEAPETEAARGIAGAEADMGMADVDAQQAEPTPADAAAVTAVTPHSRASHSSGRDADVRGAGEGPLALDDPDWYQHFRSHLAAVRAALGDPAAALQDPHRVQQPAGEDDMDIEAGGASATAHTDASGGGSPHNLAPDSSDTSFIDSTWRQLQSSVFRPHPPTQTPPPPVLQRAQTPAAFRGGARGGRPRSAGTSGVPATGLQSTHSLPAHSPNAVPTPPGGSQAPTLSTAPVHQDIERRLQLLRNAEYAYASSSPMTMPPHNPLEGLNAAEPATVDAAAAAEVPMVAAGGGHQPTQLATSQAHQNESPPARPTAMRHHSLRTSQQPDGLTDSAVARRTHHLQRYEDVGALYRARPRDGAGYRETLLDPIVHPHPLGSLELARWEQHAAAVGAEGQLEGRALRWEERALMRALAAGAETRRAPREPHIVEVGNLC